VAHCAAAEVALVAGFSKRLKSLFYFSVGQALACHQAHATAVPMSGRLSSGRLSPSTTLLEMAENIMVSHIVQSEPYS